jgi:Fe-S cluster biosynthesis and repair protein YggX
MSRIIQCAKLGVQAEGLDNPPFPGIKGQQIFEQISKIAWQDWLKTQTILINEYRLASYDPQARQFLAEQRERFLFSKDFEMPKAYTPPKLS